MIRTAKATADNQDVFIWTLYQLGGSDRSVDVEEIFLRAFEIAPARFGWRTRPDIPDYKKIAKALQTVEADSHVGLVRKVDRYTRRLTPEGAAWVADNYAVLERLYGGSSAVAAQANNAHAEIARRVRDSRAFQTWHAGHTPALADAALAVDCSAASSDSLWARRCDEIVRAGQVLSDSELESFGNTMRSAREGV
jgi:hypothetical protein